MTKRAFLQIQAIGLQNLLDSAGDDPILVPQLRERLADVQRELEAIPQTERNLTMPDPIMPVTPEPPKPGFLSSEFATSIGTVLASVVAVFVALGKINADQGASLTANITAGIVALGGLLASGAMVWKFISGRTEVKAKAEEVKIAVEETRAAVETKKTAEIQLEMVKTSGGG